MPVNTSVLQACARSGFCLKSRLADSTFAATNSSQVGLSFFLVNCTRKQNSTIDLKGIDFACVFSVSQYFLMSAPHAVCSFGLSEISDAKKSSHVESFDVMCV